MNSVVERRGLFTVVDVDEVESRVSCLIGAAGSPWESSDFARQFPLFTGIAKVAYHNSGVSEWSGFVQ